MNRAGGLAYSCPTCRKQPTSSTSRFPTSVKFLGIILPESVKAATADFFAHNDFLNDFLSEMCVAESGEAVRISELTKAYRQWCEDQGEEPAQGRTFNRMMEERGFVRKQARVNGIGGKAWIGIRLKEHDELVSESTDLTPGLARMRQLLNKDRSLRQTKREQAA
jgi:phage/plasmid-associated DNA primase